MKFGFLKFFLLLLVLVVGGVFGFVMLKDVPVQQQEVIVNIPDVSGQ